VARYLDRVTLLVLHYDNRADPTAEDEATGAYAWNTHFDSIGLRLQTDNGWTAIIQWLKGQTSVEPDGEYYAWPFYTQFALVSRHWGRNTVSARYDEFGVDSEAPLNLGDEDGHAWTVAYSFDQSANWRFTLEWLHVTSEVASRATRSAPARTIRTCVALELPLRALVHAGGDSQSITIAGSKPLGKNTGPGKLRSPGFVELFHVRNPCSPAR
jgi:hypothetical protein